MANTKFANRLKQILVAYFCIFVSINSFAQFNDFILHNPQPINLVNPYQSIDNKIGNWHPSVVYFKNGWGKPNKKYWMAWTPNLVGNLRYENPCIAYSDDGINWETTEISNPIAQYPGDNVSGNPYAFNSDPELFYNSDKDSLYCAWRFFKWNTGRVFVKQSKDGINWGDNKFDSIHQIYYDTRIFQNSFYLSADSAYKGLICPVVCYDERSKYYNFYFNRSNSYSEHLGYYKFIKDDTFKNIDSTIVLTDNNISKVNSWHFDILKNPIDNHYYVVTDGAINNGQVWGNSYLWFGQSLDTLGNVFQLYEKPLIDIDGWYRITAILDNNDLKLWFGNINGSIYFSSIDINTLKTWQSSNGTENEPSELDTSKPFYLIKNISNPMTNEMVIPFHAKGIFAINFEVRDINGCIVYKDSMQTKRGENTFSIKEKLPGRGIYFFKIYNAEYAEQKKIIFIL